MDDLVKLYFNYYFMCLIKNNRTFSWMMQVLIKKKKKNNKDKDKDKIKWSWIYTCTHNIFYFYKWLFYIYVMLILVPMVYYLFFIIWILKMFYHTNTCFTHFI
jgi:hypothetical protein